MRVIIVLSTILALELLQFNEAAVLKKKFLGAKGDSHGKHGTHTIKHREELLFAKQKMSGQRNANVLEMTHKTAYWGTIQVGRPLQEFSVIFDTGSGNLILPSVECTMPGCTAHKRYDPTKTGKGAETSEGYDYTTIEFGTGEIEGDFRNDQFCIAPGLCTELNMVASVKQSSMPFASTPFDGICGLGLTGLSLGDHFNVLDELRSVDMLPMGTFAVFLTDDDANSELTFGGYRPEHIASEIIWAKVIKAEYWEVHMDDITFDNVETGLCPGGCDVAVDTGTSMMAGPSSLVSSLTSKLGGNLCGEGAEKLPRIGFKLGKKVLNLLPEDYMDGCSFSMMSLDIPPPMGPLFVFGDPFLRRFVTIYDKHAPRVGFAVANHPGMDAAKASKIISNVDGEQAATGGTHADPVASSEMIPVDLVGGYMTLLQDQPQKEHPPLISVKLNRAAGAF